MRIKEELLGKLYNSADSLHNQLIKLGNLAKLEDRAGESTQALQKAIKYAYATLQRATRFEKRFRESLEKGLKTSNYQCLGIVHNHGDNDRTDQTPESLPSSFITICISDGLRARKALESIYESYSTAEEIIEASKFFPWLPVRVECYDSCMTSNTTSRAQRLYIYAGDPNLILKNWLKTQITSEWKK